MECLRRWTGMADRSCPGSKYIIISHMVRYLWALSWLNWYDPSFFRCAETPRYHLHHSYCQRTLMILPRRRCWWACPAIFSASIAHGLACRRVRKRADISLVSVVSGLSNSGDRSYQQHHPFLERRKGYSQTVRAELPQATRKRWSLYLGGYYFGRQEEKVSLCQAILVPIW